jgi:branched-chain amino acid transport system ATP-binding protein
MSAILQASGLVKNFDGFLAVNGVDLAVEQGSIHSLIGPNGAGKTTLFYMIAGYLKPSGGRLSFCGREISSASSHDVARGGLVCAFQITHIFPRLSVIDCVKAALIARQGKGCNFWSPLGNRLTDRALALLDDVGLSGVAEQRAGTLSYGDQRVLEVLLALATEPRMILLDEPTAGMSPLETDRVTRLIKRLTAERGVTVLLVEHDVGVVFAISDRITVLHQGNILKEGTPAEVSRDPEVIDVYLGSAL